MLKATFISARVAIQAISLSAALSCVPAMAEVNSAELDSYNLSDDEIASLCSAAIAQKLDMVMTSDGRKITSCQETYETARTVARSYRDAEGAALNQVNSGKVNCDGNANQVQCLKAAEATSEAAEGAFQNLEDNAAQGEQILIKLAGQ